LYLLLGFNAKQRRVSRAHRRQGCKPWAPKQAHTAIEHEQRRKRGCKNSTNEAANNAANWVDVNANEGTWTASMNVNEGVGERERGRGQGRSACRRVGVHRQGRSAR
jgi:hypothetical protein